MKIYTSYFYKIRFFKPNMIPISTAKWDPRWFHQGYGKNYVWFDNNGVINGLRAEPFAPDYRCDGLCSGSCEPKDPDNCLFLKQYFYQLKELDFNNIMERLENLANKVKATTNFSEEPIIVLIVHEADDNVCSERGAIQKWFAENGVEVVEWDEKFGI